jgi:hypothetical protein
VSWPVTLTSSAPIVSARDGGELTVLVGFERGTREFVASSREGAGIHPVFVGPSLTLACSAANQARQMLAPLSTVHAGGLDVRCRVVAESEMRSVR